MLSLTRRIGEALVFFDEDGREILRIAPTRVHCSGVRLRLDMPPDIHVMRSELLAPVAVVPAAGF